MENNYNNIFNTLPGDIFDDVNGSVPKDTIRESTVINILNGNVDNIAESDLAALKSKLKEAEKKIKENNKPKTITISAKDHNIIKKHCTTYGLNIGDWVAKVALKEISDNSCVIIEEGDNEEIQKKQIKELTNRFLNEQNRRKYLIKTNKIIVNTQFKFEGYSIVDSKPIYEFVGDMTHFKTLNNLDERGIELELVSKGEISLNIFSNMDLEVETYFR